MGLPPLLFALAGLVLLVGETTSFQPLWPPNTLSLAEAAYQGDQAGVARLLLQGDDANGRGRLRAGMLGAAEVVLTPMQAAVEGANVRGGQIDIVKTLLTLGARAEGESGRRAGCLALAANDRRTVRLLRAQGVILDRGWCGERGWN